MTSIHPRKAKVTQLYFNRRAFRLRQKIDNLFAKLEDWWRMTTRFD
ncbi:hypothetical protein [uncultured Bartonella sp.]|nr:hypothetical protein [uncultured Bartonella sp.]